MTATLHVLRPDTPPIAGYLRIGHTGHRKLAELNAAGRLHFKRAVFDASHIAEQQDLLTTLKASGCEIVLDPNMAEMAALGRYASSVSKLPWANPDRSWTPEDFGRTRNMDMVGNWHAHFLTQRSRQLDDLSSVPEARRVDHFLLRHLDPAVRSARSAAKLKITDEQMLKSVMGAKTRLIRIRDALGDLQARGAPETRSRALNFRGGTHPISAVLGR